MDWYYAEAGQRTGPIPEAELRRLLAAGTIKRESLVWRAGMAGWEPLGNLEEFEGGVAVATASVCTECGREFSPEDLLAFEAARICGGCKALFFERLREVGASAALRTSKRYGGFWIRVLARLIDSAILGAAFTALIFVWEAMMQRVLLNPGKTTAYDFGLVWAGLGVVYLASTVAFVVYEAWFLSHRGATPGKLAVGVRVVRGNGDNLTRGRSIGRSFAYLLTNMLPLAIGFIMAGVDDEKRALHDRLCDTRVVYKS